MRSTLGRSISVRAMTVDIPEPSHRCASPPVFLTAIRRGIFGDPSCLPARADPSIRLGPNATVMRVSRGSPGLREFEGLPHVADFQGKTRASGPPPSRCFSGLSSGHSI
jgi:hypothetical protein